MIAVDANGADRGAGAVAEGARLSGERTLLFGPAAELGGPAGPSGAAEEGPAAEVVDAPLALSADDEPVRLVRSSPNASIVQAARAVADGRAEALVSAGSTGPTLAAATLHVRRIPGVHRPAIAVLLPVPSGPTLLLDAGANVEVRPEHLVQFAYLGASFMQAVHGLARPRVGLLSIGHEASKGTPDVVEAAARLAGGPLDFAGNVEGFDLPAGAVDVVVSDGFTGNVALKLMEGVSQTLLRAIRDVALSSPRAKAGGLLLRPALRGFRDELDPELSGGAHLLGLRRLGVVPHGRFSRVGFRQAILLAARGAELDVAGRTHAALDAAGALRPRPPAADASESATSVPTP